MELGAGGGAGAGHPKVSSLATLIAQGARVTPTSNSTTAEGAALNELRRIKKTVEVYLNKTHEIDTSITIHEVGRRYRTRNGARATPSHAL